MVPQADHLSLLTKPGQLRLKLSKRLGWGWGVQLISSFALTIIIYRLSQFIIKAINLRVSPWVLQAGVLHAISLISMKLSQFKGSTAKVKMTNWFMLWIFMVGDSPPNWFN